jgi:hypothetical protein
MRKRHLGLSIILSLVFVATLALPCWAVTQLHIVRASDGSLWKMTCEGLTCSGFTSFPGNFASQPSVSWDESIKRYVLMGVADNGSIWRSTFDVGGTFQNDWVTIPGNASSPVGSASGDFFESHVWYSSTEATTTIGTTCTNYSGGSVTVAAPSSGIIVVEADIILRIDHTNGGSDLGEIYIGETNTECISSYTNSSWIYIPSGYPTDITYPTVHFTRTFLVSAGAKTFYLNGIMEIGQSTNDSFWYANMKAVYYPY